MPSRRFRRGLKIMRAVDGPKVVKALSRRLSQLDGRIFSYLVEFAFGDIYGRDGDLKYREVAAIAALVALGGSDAQLRTHLEGAKRVGLTSEEILEVVITLIPYVGFPRVLGALDVYEAFQIRD